MSRKVCVFLFGLLSLVSARRVNFYRKDYTFFPEYDAFYKLHGDGNRSSWNLSFMACDDEGAELFYPADDHEWEVAPKLIQMSGSLLSSNDIFVGIHDKFVLGEYMNINGRPTNISIENLDNASDQQHCVTMDTQNGSFKISQCDSVDEFRSFICKKVEDVTCPTIDQGYKYVKETRKCYKVNNNPKFWSKAMETCYMEGGLLLVVESEIESKIVHDLLISNENYHVGFKKMFPINEFYSVKGHKLKDTGFNVWYDENRQHEKDCGAVFNYNNRLYLNAFTCDSEEMPFICEMNVTV